RGSLRCGRRSFQWGEDANSTSLAASLDWVIHAQQWASEHRGKPALAQWYMRRIDFDKGFDDELRQAISRFRSARHPDGVPIALLQQAADSFEARRQHEHGEAQLPFFDFGIDPVAERRMAVLLRAEYEGYLRDHMTRFFEYLGNLRSDRLGFLG